MSNRYGIWTLRSKNMEFQSVFATNRYFSLKCEHYVQPVQNMGVKTKKYGVSVSFCRKLTIFDKTIGLTYGFQAKN
jgi:hypothetical protein